MITWTLTAEMRPLPATLGPGGAGRTPDSPLQVKPPAWPKRLLFGTSKLITENKETRWGTAPGPAEAGGAASVNLVRLGNTSPDGPKCIVSEPEQAAELRPLEELELQAREGKHAVEVPSKHVIPGSKVGHRTPRSDDGRCPHGTGLQRQEGTSSNKVMLWYGHFFYAAKGV